MPEVTSAVTTRTSARRSLVAVSALALVASMAATAPSQGVSRVDTGRAFVECRHGASGATSRQRDFTTSGRAAGVPASVLKAVSYLESRWDDHAGEPSTAAGYGPMHLTDAAAAALDAGGRGDGTVRQPLMSLETVRLASRLTGLSAQSLRSNPGANVCGGAAVLAYFQRLAGRPTGSSTSPSEWMDAVARYSGSSRPETAGRFVQQVYSVLRDGAARTTNDGQRVRLAPHPDAQVPRPMAANGRRTTTARIDCPRSLGCWWVPAPYQWYGKPDPYAYGNHDVADRPNDLSIDYIVIHDTEATWDSTLDLVTDPTYVSWQYSVRSRDGQVAQHVRLRDVAWQAGNWYVNMHSIGLEHEGFAAAGATWYTESLYRSSASLVRYLTHRYGIPRNRAHIIGHDQVPGITPDYVAGMHWDPGPYWEWQHYMQLVRNPHGGYSHHSRSRPKVHVGDVVTVRPGFADNVQPVTGCTNPGVPCDAQGTNFVYLHRRPNAASPLVTDIGLHPDGSPSTTDVADIGARASAGQKLVVTQRRGRWLGVWWLGHLAWLKNPPADPVVFSANALKVRLDRGLREAPVYGRAYPEQAAYPDAIAYQTVTPLQYSVRRGQAYALADASVATDYYYAVTFDDSAPRDHTVVRGQDRYYEIWFGHRMAFVRAADVRITN